jgi:hypothetical protein
VCTLFCLHMNAVASKAPPWETEALHLHLLHLVLLHLHILNLLQLLWMPKVHAIWLPLRRHWTTPYKAVDTAETMPHVRKVVGPTMSCRSHCTHLESCRDRQQKTARKHRRLESPVAGQMMGLLCLGMPV